MTFQTIDLSRLPASKKPKRRRRAIMAAGGLAAVLLAGFYAWNGQHGGTSSSTTLAPHFQRQSPQENVFSYQQLADPDFNKKQYSTTEPASPWVIVNKRRPLVPKDYAPSTVVPKVPLRLADTDPEMSVASQAAPDLEAMFTAAKQAGYDLMLASGYRPYPLQVTVYDAEVKDNGQAAADRESARPGYSEHQTGLAVDIEPASRQCEVQDCFGGLPEGKWLAANAHSYGFVMRYTPGGESVTGYRQEAWHFRYVGKQLSQEIYRLGNPPLELFFGLEAAPDY